MVFVQNLIDNSVIVTPVGLDGRHISSLQHPILPAVTFLEEPSLITIHRSVTQWLLSLPFYFFGVGGWSMLITSISHPCEGGRGEGQSVCDQKSGIASGTSRRAVHYLADFPYLSPLTLQSVSFPLIFPPCTSRCVSSPSQVQLIMHEIQKLSKCNRFFLGFG